MQVMPATLRTVTQRVLEEGIGTAYRSRVLGRLGIDAGWRMPVAVEHALHPPGGWATREEALEFLLGGRINSGTGQGMGGLLLHGSDGWGAIRFRAVTHWDGAVGARTGATLIRTPHVEAVAAWDHLQMPLELVHGR